MIVSHYYIGLFLSNYLWYYAAHPNPACRRSLQGGVAAVLEAYRSAFITQARGAKLTGEMIETMLANVPFLICVLSSDSICHICHNFFL